jgi:hypothetical protein
MYDVISASASAMLSITFAGCLLFAAGGFANFV